MLGQTLSPSFRQGTLYHVTGSLSRIQHTDRAFQGAEFSPPGSDRQGKGRYENGRQTGGALAELSITLCSVSSVGALGWVFDSPPKSSLEPLPLGRGRERGSQPDCYASIADRPLLGGYYVAP